MTPRSFREEVFDDLRQFAWILVFPVVIMNVFDYLGATPMFMLTLWAVIVVWSMGFFVMMVVFWWISPRRKRERQMRKGMIP